MNQINNSINSKTYILVLNENEDKSKELYRLKKGLILFLMKTKKIRIILFYFSNKKVPQ